MFWVSLYDCLFRTDADMRFMTGAQLIDLLATPYEAFRVRDKRTLPMWSPVRLDPPRRKKAHVVAASCLVLDYDDGTTIDQARETWGAWYHLMHTSWSHQEDHHRFRLVLPLLRDVTPEEYPTLWRWAEKHADKEIDRACKDISRAWLVPAVDMEDEAQKQRFKFLAGDGPLLDPDEVMPLAPPAPVVRLRPTISLREVQDYKHLAGLHLDPDSRAELGHALGGVVDDMAVKLVECPRCRRDSVWWWIDPTRQVNAYCNHRNTCGWKGPVAALIEENNDDHDGRNNAFDAMKA